MTAINAFAQPRGRAGYILADTAHTAPDGVVTALASKIIQSGSRFPWAIGVSGNVPALALGRELAAVGIGSLKQLEKRLAPAMRRAIEATAQAFPATRSVMSCARGVVWDFARKRPVAFQVASHPEYFLPGTEPFVWYEGAFFVTCDNHDGLTGLLGREPDLTDPDQFAADVDGLALLTAQRAAGQDCTMPGIDRAARYRIGGEAHLVTVTKRGVLIEGLVEWPDRVGERINPS